METSKWLDYAAFSHLMFQRVFYFMNTPLISPFKRVVALILQYLRLFFVAVPFNVRIYILWLVIETEDRSCLALSV